MLGKLAIATSVAVMMTQAVWAAEYFEPAVVIDGLVARLDAMDSVCIDIERTTPGGALGPVTRPVTSVCLPLWPDVPDVNPSAQASYSLHIQGCLERTAAKGGDWCSPRYRVTEIEAGR